MMKIIQYHFEVLTSTNDWGKANFTSFDKNNLTMITANAQTAARGQYGRAWISYPHKNLNLTFCFFSEGQEPFLFTHLLGLSVAQVLALPFQMKWPNDLKIGDKKIAGILCETISLPCHQGIVLGLGLNVNLTTEELAVIDQPATSILEESGQQTNLPQLLNQLAQQFASNLTLFFKEGIAPFERGIRALFAQSE